MQNTGGEETGNMYNVSHDVRMLALAEHANLLLYVCNLVALPVLDDFYRHKLASRLQEGFVD
jgi:hypothetical protein